jgi:hypothetical protein
MDERKLESELEHHEPTGTTSVKKLDDTPAPRPGRLEDLTDLEDPPMHGTGGGRRDIGLPDHPGEGPAEVLEIEGVVPKKRHAGEKD